MLRINHIARFVNPLLAVALTVIIAPWSIAGAATSVKEQRAASPQGTVEIINVAGSIDVQGWDQSQVEVTGSIGKDVQRVEVSGDGNRTSVRVVLPEHGSWNSGKDGEAHLLVHVPAGSSIATTLVSSDLKVSGVRGDAKLQTVSGSISGEVDGDLHANSVSGEIQLAAATARAIEVKTVSGDIELTGGNSETDITTVSGNAKLNLGTVPRARFKTVSGDISVNLGAGSDAQISSESVSGDVRLEFAGIPAADFDVQTLSGDIENCFGPKPIESHHGSGARLTFKNGDTRATVRVASKSGDVNLCIKSASGERSAKKP